MRGRSLIVTVFALWMAATAAAWADPADDFIRAEMKRQNIPGLAVAVVRDGTVIKAAGYGVANLKTKEPVTPDTMFKIASVSKQFVAAGIMVLAQDGRLSVEDPVSKHIPGVPAAWNGIRIRHLLSHTAGLVREPPAFDPFKTTSDAELIASAYAIPLRFTPGEKWEYANLGYNILVEIITRASGRPWPDFIAERVFKPGGLTATRTTTTAPLPNKAMGHTDNDNPREVADWPAVRAGGAFFSTVLDLARWDAVLSTDSVLKEPTRTAMWTPVTFNNGSAGLYGFGWHTNRPGNRRQVWHSGGLPGFSAQFHRYLDDRISVIVLMNSDDVDDETILAGVANLYLPDRK